MRARLMKLSLTILFFFLTPFFSYAEIDTFDRPNGTSLGAAWNEYLPNLEIFNNQLRNVDANVKEARIVQSIGPDQDVAVDCKVAATGNSCGVMARWSNGNNFYSLRLDAGLGNIALFKKVNGVYTRLAAASRPLKYNTFYKLRLVVKGNALSVYFANEAGPALALNDPFLTGGNYAGIRGYAAAASSTYFDNFSALAISAPVNQLPVARMTVAPQSGAAPLTVHFDGSASSDPDGAIVASRFDFGDGTSGAGPIVDHTYSAAKVYTATLIVTDNRGGMGITHSSVKVTAPALSCIGVTRPPYIAFDASTTVTLAWECAPQAVLEWGSAPALTNRLEVTHGGETFHDDFGRPDATDLGAGWDEYRSDLGITGGHVSALNAASQEARITTPLGPDQSVATDCEVQQAQNSCGVMARWSDPDNYYYVRLDGGQRNIRLFKKAGGVFTLLGEALRPIAYGSFYHLRLSVNQRQLQVFFANETTPAIAISDASLTEGDFAGIRSSTGAARMVFFDNFMAEGQNSGNKHFVTLPNLMPNTLYSYRVTVNSVLLGEATFETAKGAGDNNFTFVAFGDGGTGTADQAALALLMEKTSFSFGLIAGDVVYEKGYEGDFDPHYFVPYRKSINHLPFFPVVGNHDIETDGGVTFRSNFLHPTGRLYYDFHWGETHFIALNSNTPADPQQLAWLDQILARSAARWKVVYFHHPPHSSSTHGSNLEVQAHFVPLLEKYHVDIVFSGHDHDYERTQPINGVQYIVTGGGGAPLYPAGTSGFTAYSKSTHHIVIASMTAGTLTLRAADENGTVFDSFTLKKPGVAATWTATPIIGGVYRYSHPRPFQLDNGELLLGFSTNEDTATSVYKLARSTDGGNRFPTESRLVIAQEAGNNIFEGAFAQLNDASRTLIAVYGPETDVRLKKSIDRGATWGAATTLVTGAGYDPHPDIKLLSNGDLYLVYSAAGNIFGRRSSTRGESWSSGILISSQADTLRDPSVAEAANGDLLVSFMNTGPLNGIQLARSTNSGTTWSTPSNIRGAIGATDVNDANLLRLSNGQLLLSFSVGLRTTGPPPAFGARKLWFLISDDHGVTWPREALVYDTGDPHRGNFTQLANGAILGAFATIEGDTDYHIAKLTPPLNFPPP